MPQLAWFNPKVTKLAIKHYLNEQLKHLLSLASNMPHGLELPHGVQKCPVVFDPQQFIRHRHVMSHRLFPVVKESVWSPDFTGHQVVQGQNIHWSMKFQPLILPALAEENIYCVLLWKEGIYAEINPNVL